VTDWLRPVRDALDSLDTPVECFVRDDDGGWADDRLFAMLDLFERYAMPIDVAVIPHALEPSLAGVLASRTGGDVVHLHQHGYAHVNHEPPDRRKCEFGPARPLDALHHDVARGWQRLTSLLGDAVEPVFTPPWNRCVDGLADVLAAVGHRVLSRDHTAGAIGHAAVAEVAINVDWFGSTKGERWSRRQLGERVASRIASGGPVGLMLHHGVTDDAGLAELEQLIAVLAAHEMVRRTSILDRVHPTSYTG
jgi:peptidoglycan/xylan/chitin deacetylase (PgdA/CDA1 family)